MISRVLLRSGTVEGEEQP